MDITKDRAWVYHLFLAEMVDTNKSSDTHCRAMENKLATGLAEVFVQDIEDCQRLDRGQRRSASVVGQVQLSQCSCVPGTTEWRGDRGVLGGREAFI